MSEIIKHNDIKEKMFCAVVAVVGVLYFPYILKLEDLDASLPSVS